MGLATAKLLASRGASLSIADMNKAASEQVVSILPGGSEKHMATTVDVRDGSAVESWIEGTVQRYGKLDGAVNMAGVLGSASPVADLKSEDFDFVLSVNLKGVFNCLHAQLKAMTTGSIVSNIDAGYPCRHEHEANHVVK